MAAGLGFKTFTTGEVLTAADVNGYLMQGVLVFASAAARNAAITSPQEGQFAFTKDTNGLWYYDGAAWVASGATGDIEGVTAGVGITGGGTSGTVTITNDMATTITAAGDIVVGTGSGTYDNLPIGTTAQVLTADTTVSPYKVKWATASSGSLTLTSATSFSAVSSHTVTGAFTSTYQNYICVLQLTSAAVNYIDFRLATSGTANTTGNYQYQRFESRGTNGSNQVNTNQDRFALTSNNCDAFSNTFTIFSPQLSAKTFYTSNTVINALGSFTAPTIDLSNGIFNATTVFDGISIIPNTSTITGTLKIYGLAN